MVSLFSDLICEVVWCLSACWLFGVHDKTVSFRNCISDMRLKCYKCGEFWLILALWSDASCFGAVDTFVFICCGIMTPKRVAKSCNWYTATWQCCFYVFTYSIQRKHYVSDLYHIFGHIGLGHCTFCHCYWGILPMYTFYFFLWHFHNQNSCHSFSFCYYSGNNFRCNFDIDDLFLSQLEYINIAWLFLGSVWAFSRSWLYFPSNRHTMTQFISWLLHNFNISIFEVFSPKIFLYVLYAKYF